MLPTKMPRLHGSSIILRDFEDRDVELVMSVSSDPLIPLITTVPASGRREDAMAFLERQNARLTAGGGYSFAIADAVTDEAIGQIGLWLRDINDGRASTGYWVAPQHRGKGFAKDALRTLTDWALCHDEVQRLQLYAEPWNVGSWRAAESCGYEREGLLRAWQRVGPERKDMYVYSKVA